MITLADARQEVLDDPDFGPAIGWYGTATTLAANSLTDPVRFGGFAGNYFSNQGRVALPSLSSNDRERDVGILTAGGGGTIALRGPAIAAVGSNVPYLFLRRGIHLDRFNNCFDKAVAQEYFQQRSAVSNIFPDGDLLGQDYGGWLASHSDLSFSFDNSAEYNDSGYYSLLLNFGGALNTRYLARAAHWGMQSGERFYLAAIIKLVSGGPLTWDVYNETTAAKLRSTVTISQTGEWFHVGGQYTTGSIGNHNLRIGANAGTIAVVDCLPNHYLDGLGWDAPSYIDQRFKLDRIDEYEYSRRVTTDVDMARSRQYTSWRRRRDFDVEVLAGEANPGRVQLLPPRRSLPAHDLFYRVTRRMSDLYTLGESNPTPGTDDTQVMYQMRVEVANMLEARDRLGPNGLWQQKAREFQAGVDSYREVEEEQITPVKQPNHRRLAV